MKSSASITRDMQMFGWTDIWFPARKRWYVGVWTGPDNDLLCVKHCKTNAEAEQFLSPCGSTLAEACTRAVNTFGSAGVGEGVTFGNQAPDERRSTR